jgi:hypothetical protein
MHEDAFVSVVADSRAREEILEQGFTRRPLCVDVDVARALGVLAHAAWFLPKDQYYEGGDRYRSLNRFKAEIAEGGVRVWPYDDSKPYVQLEKYNTTLGGQPREYAPIPKEIADTAGVRKMIAHHLMYLPLSAPGVTYSVQHACASIRRDPFPAVRYEPARLA